MKHGKIKHPKFKMKHGYMYGGQPGVVMYHNSGYHHGYHGRHYHHKHKGFFK
jgi:hypothetical protein